MLIGGVAERWDPLVYTVYLLSIRRLPLYLPTESHGLGSHDGWGLSVARPLQQLLRTGLVCRDL